MMIMSRFYKVSLLCLCAASLSFSAQAQDVTDNVLTLETASVDGEFFEESAGGYIDDAQDETDVEVASINPENIRSLMYNAWEHSAVIDALSARSYVDIEAYRRRALGGTASGDGTGSGTDEFGADQPAEPDNSIRELSLGGILYSDKKDWTIWLNGQRITPATKPEEVVGLKVFKDYIELKWFDKKSLQIYPIRLRSHQRFNLDNNLFLPG